MPNILSRIYDYLTKQTTLQKRITSETVLKFWRLFLFYILKQTLWFLSDVPKTNDVNDILNRIKSVYHLKMLMNNKGTILVQVPI